MSKPDNARDDAARKSPATERYLEYGETAIKLGLMMSASGSAARSRCSCWWSPSS
jgi:hypothetical protein